MNAKRAHCLLGLGSNQGRRRQNFRRALARLKALPGGRVLARSRLYDTAPVGPKQRRFLNMVLRYRTSLTPMGLLIELKRLEARAGRGPGTGARPRPLDIDILDYGSRRLHSPWLTLPHPLAAERAFVLAPLCDIAPRFKPARKATAARLLKRLRPNAHEVRVVSP